MNTTSRPSAARRALIDLAAGLALLALAWALFARLDLHERLDGWFLAREAWEADELFPLALLAAVAGVAFALRRCMDSSRELQRSRRAEGELRASEQKHRLLIENAAVAVTYFTMDGRIELINAASAKMMGGTPEGLVGRPLHEVLPDIAERNSERMRQIAETGKGASYEDLIEFPLGPRWFVSDLQPVNGPGGPVTAIQVISRDITERRLAEQAIQERVKELDCLYGLARLVEDAAAELGQVLQAAAELLPPALQHPEAACARMTFDGREFRTAGFAETAWLQRADIRVHGEKRGSVEAAYLEKRPEADEGPFLSEERNLIDALARSLGEYVERREAEAALRRSEERHRAIFDGAAEGILIADLETRTFIYANAAICNMLDYSREELIGMGVADIHPEYALDHVISEFESLTRGEKTMAGSVPCLRKDGAVVHADITGARMVIDGRDCFVGFFTDVGDRKKAEEARLRAARLEAVIETAGGACHELNQPMQAAIGYAELALNQLGDGDPVRDDVVKLNTALGRMADITRRLDTITRYETKGYPGGAKIMDLARSSPCGGE